PVMINPAKLRGPASRLLVAVAGPFTNLAIAVAISVPLRLLAGTTILGTQTFDTGCSLSSSPLQLLTSELFYVYSLNLFLMVFNLIPVPPLDGFELIRTGLTRRNPRLLWQIERNRQAILIGFFLFAFVLPQLGFPNFIAVVLGAIVTPVANLLGVPIAFPCG
ncbi:MAG TPA: site-2 protease family protein, partial [Candidatus Dormibacteraeota bacterium]|nr:site-2 protease family protein [Candidatus Dormibacteraeota bacterium]